MRESKSKCRRKRHEGEYENIIDDRREAKERRVVEDRRIVEERRFVEAKPRSRPHPLDPFKDGRYFSHPSEEKHRSDRYKHQAADDRCHRNASEDKRVRHENGSLPSEDHLNGHHHHHHRRHKQRETSSEPIHKKKKSCRRKRDRKTEETKLKRDRSRSRSKRRSQSSSKSPSLSPSPSSSSSLSQPPSAPATAPAPASAPAPKPKEQTRDVAPATHLGLPAKPKPPAKPSFWDDDENRPARYRTDWGRKEGDEDDKKDKKPVENIAKPDFGLSGKLVEEVNTYKGVVIKYSQPPEARMPKRRWRLYPFKGDQALPTLYIHRQSAYLIGRERKIVDIPVDHPSISKQHAVLQYRLVPYTKDDGSKVQRIRPYIIDLNSANGTYVNNQRIDAAKYVELLERDVVKFAFSSREYVLLHEHSTEGLQDDEAV